MNRFWSREVHSLTPYVPGEQPVLAGLVKLNTNENPFPPSPRVIEAIRRAASDELRLYPDPHAAELKRVIAGYYQVTPASVFAGNGSDEVLAHAFKALLRHDAPILLPEVSYSFYPVYCRLFDIGCRRVPLDDRFRIRIADYAAPNGGIVLANPNAPTGCLLPLQDIDALLAANRDSVVVIDEAYIDFGGDSAVVLVGRHPNLLVVQTLSKSRSLAGLRVGFAIGDPGLIEALERVKSSFNSYPLDRLAIAGAIEAFADRDHFEQTRRAIIGQREVLRADLERLGFDVLPSAANFLFARHPRQAAMPLAAALRDRGIVVRHFAQPRIDQFLRITVGNEPQCAALVGALQQILA